MFGKTVENHGNCMVNDSYNAIATYMVYDHKQKTPRATLAISRPIKDHLPTRTFTFWGQGFLIPTVPTPIFFF